MRRVSLKEKIAHRRRGHEEWVLTGGRRDGSGVRASRDRSSGGSRSRSLESRGTGSRMGQGKEG